MALLEIEEIRHRFDGLDVVRGVTLHLDAGEILCLLGPSGCGKTTLLRLTAGLEPVQHGCVRIAGDLVGAGSGVQVPPEARRIGFMFQDFALFPHLSVRQNIFFGVARGDAARRAWVEEAATRVGIDTIMGAYPHTLSGGQQQRVALLRALAPGPRLLLLDEPFSGLDVTRRAAVREHVQELLQETGIATLMVTHDPEEAMFMADRILVMDGGRIVQAGTPEEVYSHPATSYVAGLFGSVNRLEGRVQDGHVATLIGTFPAPGLHGGARAEVIIRPEGLVLEADAQGPRLVARVVDARLLGDAIHVRLLAQTSSGDKLELQARIRGGPVPPRGSQVGVGVADPDKAFVFAA